MKVVFVDTGGWYALLNRRDTHHGEAVRFLREGERHFLTTNYVVLETVNLLNSRAGHGPARLFLERLADSKLLTLHHISPIQHRRAELYFQRRADKGYSLTDCSSFVVMEEAGLKEAFAFDRHFTQAGFTLLP
ncbi:MAG: PIN domain-containing protein [Elusimicrobiota bacterium]